MTELAIIARFRAREGADRELAQVLADQVDATRSEPGCLWIAALRALKDPRLFWIHSRWSDEAAFQVHADLSRTQAFVERAQALIDHPFEANRAHRIG
jgi:quinol monooxygenase YgiN